MTYEFVGTITEADGTYAEGFQPPANFPSLDAGDESNLWGTLGKPISATITIEDSVADVSPENPVYGNYPDAVLAFTVNLNGSVFDFDPGSPRPLWHWPSVVNTYHNPPNQQDYINIIANLGYGIFASAPQDQYLMSFGLYSELPYSQGLVLDSDSLEIDLDRFPWRLDVVVGLMDPTFPSCECVSVASTGSLRAVPEPTSALLLGAGTLALAAVRSRRRSTRR